MKEDVVNKPKHYQSPYPMENGEHIQAIDVIEAFGLGFRLGNTVKYICRADKKGAHLQDLKKAAFYLAREIQFMEGNQPKKRRKRKTRGRQTKWTKVKPHLRRAGKDTAGKVVSLAKVLAKKQKRKPFSEWKVKSPKFKKRMKQYKAKRAA